MQIWQAIILGAVQGLTEFLPISSSGHLVLMGEWLGVADSDLSFEIFVHLATLLAVIFFFWRQIVQLKFRDYILLGVGTVPAVIVTILFKDWLEASFGSATWIGWQLVATGFINLYSNYRLTHRLPTEVKEVSTPNQAFLIGWAQAFAIIPGISRSSSTLAGALALGISRTESFTYSFLLSIPAILGASVLILADLDSPIQQLMQPTYVLGGLTAFITGFASLFVFKYVITSAKLTWFAVYCFILGASTILIF